MRKLSVGLMLILLLSGVSAFADEFSISSNYDWYMGGYVTSSEKHWTEYRLRSSDITIGAGIKIGTNATEVKNGIGTARVTSKHVVGPYYNHTHSKYTY